MDADELERLIGAELKQLPAPRAPRTLLPRVLEAVGAPAAGTWYSRPWLAWPLVGQALSAVALLVLVLGVGALAGPVREALVAAAAPCPPALAPCAASRLESLTWLAGLLREASTLARLLWQVLLVPLGYWLVGVAVVLSLACGAVWVVLDRLVLGEASQS